MTKNLKKIVIVALIIGGGLLAYSFLRPEPTIESMLETTERKNNDQVLNQEIVLAINQMKSLTLDASIFNDPVFKSLIDHSRPISPEPIGRSNPFAPIGVDFSAGVRSSTSTATTTNQNLNLNTNLNTNNATTSR
jgi:hypothetical protein